MATEIKTMRSFLSGSSSEIQGRREKKGKQRKIKAILGVSQNMKCITFDLDRIWGGTEEEWCALPTKQKVEKIIDMATSLNGQPCWVVDDWEEIEEN